MGGFMAIVDKGKKAGKKAVDSKTSKSYGARQQPKEPDDKKKKSGSGNGDGDNVAGKVAQKYVSGK